MAESSFKFEARAYGPESTPEEVQAIKGRIYLFKPGIVMYREMPVQSVFHLDLFQTKLDEVAGKLPSYCLLIDLTEANPPSAEIRSRLKGLFGSQKNLRYAGVFTAKNFMLNVAAKFVLSGIGLKAFSVHKTMEEALVAVAHGG